MLAGQIDEALAVEDAAAESAVDADVTLRVTDVEADGAGAIVYPYAVTDATATDPTIEEVGDENPPRTKD